MGLTDVEMAAFDTLPAPVREVLRGADDLWDAASVLRLWQVQRAAGVDEQDFADWLRLRLTATGSVT